MIDLTLMKIKGFVLQRNTIVLLMSLIAFSVQISLVLGAPLAGNHFNNISSYNSQKSVDVSLIDSIDYARSEQFLPNNVFPTLFNMNVTPNWINGTRSFWYLNADRDEKEFVLVDAENCTKQLVFNQSALAQALVAASHVKVDPSNRPPSQT